MRPAALPVRRSLRSLPLLLALAAAPLQAQAPCSLTNPTTWCAHQDSAGVDGTAQEDDHFAGALAFGDFNGDGFDDLAIGVPGEDDGAGFVHVLYSNGLWPVVAGQQLFSQDDLAGADGGAEDGDEFGAALAAGDFDDDGFDDLAIGSPGEDLPELMSSDCTLFECEDAGGVHVVDGAAGGLQLGAAEFLTNLDVSNEIALHEGSRFGAALAAGMITVPIDDLAIAAPLFANGHLYLIFGTEGGLNAGPSPLNKTPEPGECLGAVGGSYGASIAIGRFDDGLGRHVGGAPTCTPAGFGDAGALFIQSPDVLVRIRQLEYSTAGESPGDRFGAAVAGGDFDNNGYDDLAASAPNKDHGAGDPDASGRVYVAYSDEDGPDPSNGPDIIGEDEWAGDTPGAGEHFGSALAADDVDGDGFDDLLAGAPNEGSADVGRVYLKRGSAAGLTVVNNALFTQTFLGGSNGDDDHLGNVIALGDVDGDGTPEIAMGVPDKDVGNAPDAGMVYITRAFGPRLFKDGFESGSKGAWSAGTP